jgi:hypothetical protein
MSLENLLWKQKKVKNRKNLKSFDLKSQLNKKKKNLNCS